MNPPLLHLRQRQRQRGAVLVFALIALVVLLIGGVVMVRSMQTTLLGAGNQGFKRDLVNQGERAVQQVYQSFRTGGALETRAAREAVLVAANYSPSPFADADADGIPDALESEAAFATVGLPANDISVPDLKVRIRYVVDRMCLATGAANAATCSMSGTRLTGVSNFEQLNAAFTTSGGRGAEYLLPIYRISIKVTGPRGTESYFQTTFTL